MNIQPLEYFDADELCKFEMFGLSNATMVPVMITMTPGPIGGNGGGSGSLDGQIQQHAYIQPLQPQMQQQQQQQQAQFYTIHQAPQHQLHHHQLHQQQQQQQTLQSPQITQTMTLLQPTQIPIQSMGTVGSLPPGSIIVPTQTQLTPEQLQQHFDITAPTTADSADGSISGGGVGAILYQKLPFQGNSGCPRHYNLPPLPSHIQTKAQAKKYYEAFTTATTLTPTTPQIPATTSTSSQTSTSIVSGGATVQGKSLSAAAGNKVATINEEEEDEENDQTNDETSTSCIPGFNNVGGGNGGGGGGGNGGFAGFGSTARNAVDLFSGPEGCTVGCNALMIMGLGGNAGGNYRNRRLQNHNLTDPPFGTAYRGDVDMDEEQQVKQQLQPPCNCTYMSFDNFVDYQTTGFGGLPDVTEHSNIKRTTSRQDSISNSESGEISSLQKSKKSLKSNRSTSTTSSSVKRKFCIFSLTACISLAMCAAIATIFVYQLVFMAPSRNSHDERMKIVRKILNEVPLVDGHNDLPWNVRKYAHSSLELLDLSHELDHKTVWHRPAWSQTDITRLRQGLVGAQIWSAYVPCEAQGLDAVQLALEQIDIIHRFTELHSGETTLVISSQEILQAHSKGLMASMIGIEGGHALGSSLGVLRSFHSLGARYLTLTHQCDTTWAGSSSMTMDKGLTGFGKSVIKEMNRLGMLIDLSHSSDITAKDVLELTRAPVIFSHSVARALCNSSRNVPDDILRSVADNGGLIMISFDSEYVSCSDSSTLNDVIAHIKYIRSIAGIEHIGIGAGYDGIERPPLGLEDVSKYPNLFATLLEDSSWSEEDLAKLAGKNFIRVLKSVENVRDYWKRAAIQPVETSEPTKKTQCTYMSS